MVDELLRLNHEEYSILHKFFPEQIINQKIRTIVLHHSRLNLWESYQKLKVARYLREAWENLWKNYVML